MVVVSGLLLLQFISYSLLLMCLEHDLEPLTQALSPDVIADTIFKAAGRCTIRDQGYFSIGTKLLLKAVDWNFMGEMAPVFMRSNEDFRRLKKSVVRVNKGGVAGAAGKRE